MAFDSLTEKLNSIFSKLSGKGKLTESDVKAAMREVKMALLEADVNFKVVKQFVNSVQERAVGEEVMSGLNPAQMVIKIVNEEMTELMGSETTELQLQPGKQMTVIMMVGLQGAGKTTTAAKIAGKFKQKGKKPLLVALDIYRPAAIKQLQVNGEKQGVEVFTMGDRHKPADIARAAIEHAAKNKENLVILDTAGRLQIDEEMMQEAVDIRDAVKPDQILMVVDAMTGQDIVNVVTEFNERMDFDGVIMSKLDGDARGGGALSVREVTGKPIMFVSQGEKPDSLEVFHPDRMARRILGMGDVVGIIEQAEQLASDEAAADAERMLLEGFTMDDMLKQLNQVRKMGGMRKLIGMLPGVDRALSQSGQDISDDQMIPIEAMIHSMTKKERANPRIINGQRRKRIAEGSGRSVQEVNVLIKQWEQMDKMMSSFRSMALGGNTRGMGRAMGDMMRGIGMDPAEVNKVQRAANMAAAQNQRPKKPTRPKKKGKQGGKRRR